MYRPVLLLLLAAAAHAGTLTNSGFEIVEAGQPAGWDVFVAPQPGAHGALDSEHAFEGTQSVRLHSPDDYEVEPVNNWSQPLTGFTPGERIRIRAHIKTRDATEAAVWLQCFQRDPWRVVKQVSTSTDSPVYGTMDWTPVTIDTTIPPSTDFAMVRCVIKGHGTAWFDSVTVEAETESEVEDVAEPPEPIVAKAAEPESEEPVSISPKPAPPVAAPAPPDPDERLLQANEDLRRANDALADELRNLRTDIEALRHQLVAPPQQPNPKPAPPLVPHGYEWRDQ